MGTYASFPSFPSCVLLLFPWLSFPVSLSFHLPYPHPASCLCFKPYLWGPDCIAHKYSTFPKSNLWMLFHYSVLFPRLIRNGARLFSGSFTSTPWACTYQHGVLIMKGLPLWLWSLWWIPTLMGQETPISKCENSKYAVTRREDFPILGNSSGIRREGKLGMDLELWSR